MRDYLRVQPLNDISYDLVQLIVHGVYKIKDWMTYSLAADFFDECLETIFELIQGPNLENIQKMIQFGFVEVAKIVLEKYEVNNIKDESFNKKLADK